MAIFANRVEAAERLAAALQAHATERPLVLAIPRGAVPMGAVLARALDGDLDVVLVRKLRAPSSPELAVGAIDETGWAYLAPHAAQVGADARYIEAEKKLRLDELRQRRRLYTPSRAPLDARGRTVIVVDDGLATGSTMMAALHSVRSRAPARLVCAVPVASAESLRLVSPHADEVCCLSVPGWFGAVGQFYRDFPQVEDEEVVRLLDASRHAPSP
jgi:putative phosphoribosyl transferase